MAGYGTRLRSSSNGGQVATNPPYYVRYSAIATKFRMAAKWRDVPISTARRPSSCSGCRIWEICQRNVTMVSGGELTAWMVATIS